MTIIQNYKDNNFIYFSCTIDTYINKANKLKKKLNMPVEWQKLNKPKYNKQKNGLAIVTGEKSNLFVVDYDDKQLFKDDCDKFPELQNYYVQSKNGYHSYFLYSAELQTTLTSSSTHPVDFQGDGKCVLAPPSAYQHEDKKYKYTIESNNEITMMSPQLIQHLHAKYIKPPPDRTSTTETKAIQEEALVKRPTTKTNELTKTR